MAKPKKKGYGGKNSSKTPAKTSSNWVMLGGIAVAIIAIIVVGVVMFNQPQQAEAGENESVAAADVPTATPADRTLRYIGPESNPDEVNEAIAGKLGVPAVVFFHADW